jgi:type I restriction enzyme S subunit
MGKPKVRFKGYSDDWEQRKFDEWGTFYYGHSCPKWSVTEDATIPCIRYGELYTKFGNKIDKVFSYTNMPSENLRFSKGTEVLIPRVGEDPMDYNHCTWLSLKDVAIGEMISVFNTEQDPLFSAIMFNATLQKEFAVRVEGGSVTNLYFEKLKNIDIMYPSLKEQKKIAAFFDRLDHLITLHQRKCEETKMLKKFMLQKMFPQDGACVPKIRFSGFTDDWEQRKLGEVADIIGGGTPSTNKTSYWDGEIDWYAPAEIGNQIYLSSSERKITKEGFNSSSAKMLPVGTVLFTSRAGIGKTAILAKEGCTNQGFQSIVPHENELDSYFIYSRSEELKRYGEVTGAGSTFVEVSGKQMANMDIMMPLLIDEQKQIGCYFQKLDHLITLHQRKCEELKNVKKFMLQNMFA